MKLQRPQPEYHPRPAANEVALADKEKPVIYFDPRIEISDGEWQRMKEVIECSRNQPGVWFVQNLMHAFILFPERRDELAIDSYQDYIKRGAKDSNYRWFDRLQFARAFVMLFPGHREELELDSRWDTLKRYLETERKRQGNLGLINAAINLVSIFPERKAELNLDAYWQGMKQEMNMHRKRNWYLFSSIAADLSIIFPERRNELDFSEEDCEGIRKEIATNIYSGLSLPISACLRIITAEKAQVTEHGLELVHSGHSLQQVSKVPDRRLT